VHPIHHQISSRHNSVKLFIYLSADATAEWPITNGEKNNGEKRK
jgi:hypothetical protein